MSFAEAIRTCLRKYATFAGRASRPEYWWFALFVFLGNVILGVVDRTLFGAGAAASAGPLAAIFWLLMLLPGLAAGWRRMHDTGRSGLHLLYPLIVMVGIATFGGIVAGFESVLTGDMAALLAGATGIVIAIAFLIFLISPLIVLWWLTRPTQPGANRYGPNPHEVSL